VLRHGQSRIHLNFTEPNVCAEPQWKKLRAQGAAIAQNLLQKAASRFKPQSQDRTPLIVPTITAPSSLANAADLFATPVANAKRMRSSPMRFEDLPMNPQCGDFASPSLEQMASRSRKPNISPACLEREPPQPLSIGTRVTMPSQGHGVSVRRLCRSTKSLADTNDLLLTALAAINNGAQIVMQAAGDEGFSIVWDHGGSTMENSSDLRLSHEPLLEPYVRKSRATSPEEPELVALDQSNSASPFSRNESPPMLTHAAPSLEEMI
jgi:hypothetical protein